MTVYNYFCTTGLFLLLVCFPAQAQPSQQTPQQESPKTEQRGTPATSVEDVNVKQPESPVKQTKATGDEDEGKAVTRAEKIQIGINVLLFFIVVWQTFIYIQQRNVMREQVAHAKITERAYIGVKGVITENQKLGMIPNVRVTVVNGGRTPAWGLKCPATLVLGTEFPQERPEVSENESPTFLAADGETTYNYPFPFPLTPQWLAHFQEKGWTVYLHMEAHFRDVWGERQVMTFMLAYRPDTDRWGDYKDKQEVNATWHYS